MKFMYHFNITQGGESLENGCWENVKQCPEDALKNITKYADETYGTNLTIKLEQSFGIPQTPVAVSKTYHEDGAVILSFLIDGFNTLVNNMPSDRNIHEGIGFDHFVYGCYPIALSIEQSYITKGDRSCPGVYQYELIEDIAAKVLFGWVVENGTVPSVEEFNEEFVPLMLDWYLGD